MIGRLKGIILEKQPPLVLIEVGGVGYEAHMPIACFYKLPDVGQEAILFTHFVMGKDVQMLFGFTSKQKRNLFRELIKTNGVGIKLALAILSGASEAQFVNAVENEDSTMLEQLPGIGKKTAERLIVELKGRLKILYSNLFIQKKNNSTSLLSKESSAICDIEQEAIAALVALGYKPQKASWMISKVVKLGTNSNSETLIREALRSYVMR